MSAQREKIRRRAKAHGNKVARDDVLAGAEARSASWMSGYYAAVADVRKLVNKGGGAEVLGQDVSVWIRGVSP